MNYNPSRADMAPIPDILKYTSPEKIPLKFEYGEREICGIPAEFSPTVSYRPLSSRIRSYTIEGTDKFGLNIRAEYLEYKDFPVTEWLFYITNKGEADTPILKNIRIEGELVCPCPVLEHGNGDTCRPDGYHFFSDTVYKKISLTPFSGTSCQGAFPYMTLHGTDREIRAAIGWPAKWRAEISPTENGVVFSCSQDRCATRLHSGETYRTPRLNLMAYTNENDIYKGINLWRNWYFEHILPRVDSAPISPKLCLHYFQAEGKPEFTGASEKNQIHALYEYLRRDMKPDVWWVDAGWYPCDYEWMRTGTWCPDPERFPNGLAPLGKACDDNGIELLLWFEPERVHGGEELDVVHPDWLLSRNDDENADRLLDLGNKKALDWLIERVDAIIKESHVKVYRQDFNFDPLPIWIQNEAEDRIGMLENKHVQGYLEYWDTLLLRNPELWIDSCASGGRRNDLETMRRAVTLHYTDVGYGNHPIKQKQHREMFEWIPYFRAHNMSWDEPDGSYGYQNKPATEFDFHCALAPSLTSMYTYDDSEEHFAIGRKMDEVWREAASLELSGEYFPISECNCDTHDWYAMQFDDKKARRGFVQAIRNVLAKDDTYSLSLPCIHKGKMYTFTNAETKESFTLSAKELEGGITITLPKRTGIVYFYEFE